MQQQSHKEILKKVRRIQIRTKHAVSDLFAGEYQSVFKGSGMEFDEVREYVPGDDVHSIDWNVTARTGTPHIKKFVEERQLTLMLLVDASASQSFGSQPQLKKDLASEIAAVLAFSAIENGDRVGLIMFSDRVEKYIPPSQGTTRHVLRIVREILYHRPESKGTDPTPALDFLNHIARQKTASFLISDFIFGSDHERSLKVTAKRHDLTGVIIRDKNELAWPSVGVVQWEDSESGQSQLVDTSDRETRREFARMQNESKEQLLSDLRGYGMDTIELLAGEPYERELIRFFKKREARRRNE